MISLTKRTISSPYLWCSALIIASVIMCIIVINMVLAPSRNVFNNSKKLKANMHLHRQFLQNNIKKDYLVQTPGCTIPDLNVMDPLIVKYIYDVKPVQCNNGIRPLFEANRTSLYLLPESLKDYNITNVKTLKCCYTHFKRKPPQSGKSDIHVEYENHCTPFVTETNVDVSKEFVRLQCHYGGEDRKIIYTDYFFFIPVRADSPTIKEDKLNVMVIGIDAVSRLNFHRQMPKTAFYLKKLKAVELLGYNKIGDNTFPNLVVALTGHNKEELQKTCWPNQDSYFDDCDFIWKHYKQAGYTTAFVEDAARMGMFYYYKNGFLHQPTDYFYGHFDNAVTNAIGYSRVKNVYECFGQRPVHQVFLHYINEFGRIMHENSKAFFGFFWATNLSHDYLNRAKLGDEDYFNVLFNLCEKGVWNKTALIFMSDHGIRWGGIRSTYQGRMEERLPFVFVVLPEWYKKQHAAAFHNLRTNTRRLTTPYDLHETFLDLLGRFQDESLKNRSSTNRGISLFGSIPKERTCENASIDQHWCTCQTMKTLSVRDTNVIDVVMFTIGKINDLLLNYSDCYQLQLDDILKGSELIANNEMDNYKKSMKYFTVTFKTKPGGAIFEATVRKLFENNQFSITGTVSRLNLYGEQSKCINDFHLKLYCYCRKNLTT